MARSSIEPETIKYLKKYGFLSFQRNLSEKLSEKWFNTAAKTGLDPAKTTSK